MMSNIGSEGGGNPQISEPMIPEVVPRMSITDNHHGCEDDWSMIMISSRRVMQPVRGRDVSKGFCTKRNTLKTIPTRNYIISPSLRPPNSQGHHGEVHSDKRCMTMGLVFVASLHGKGDA